MANTSFGNTAVLRFLAQPGDAVTQDRLLNQTGFPAGAETKAKGNERRLPVGGMQRIDFVFQRLEGVVALFLGARAGIAFRIRDLPLFGDFTVLFEAFGDERRQHFIDAVNGGAAINVAGDLGDNLRRLPPWRWRSILVVQSPRCPF